MSLPAIHYRRMGLGSRATIAIHGGLLVWVGLLCVYVLSSLTAEIPGAAPTQRNWVFGRLSREHSFGQTFVAERGELVGLRVLLFASLSEREDPVTLRLRAADSALPDLAVVTLPARALARRGPTTFEIPALTFNVTTRLRLDLEAPTLAPPDWITVMAGPDSYSGGELFQDGVARPAVDLAFQPVYRHRWLDVLLPISRMAQGKPGPLGWPSLYALLAYGYSLALVRALLLLWRSLSLVVDAR